MNYTHEIAVGVSATHAIRSKEEGTEEHLPIVAVTAHAMTGDKERSLAEGLDAYVSKPIKKEELLQAMEELLGGE